MATRRTTVAGTADDPTIRFAELKFEGEDHTYRLAFNFNALALAERATGMNLLRGGLIFMNYEFSVQELRGLLFGALLIAQPDITVQEAGELLRIDRLGDVLVALKQAFALSYPTKNEEPEVLATAS